MAYLRESRDDRALVVAHRAEEPRPGGRLPVSHGGIADGTHFVDVLSGETFTTRDGALWLPEVGQGALVLRQADDNPLSIPL